MVSLATVQPFEKHESAGHYKNFGQLDERIAQLRWPQKQPHVESRAPGRHSIQNTTPWAVSSDQHLLRAEWRWLLPGMLNHTIQAAASNVSVRK